MKKVLLIDPNSTFIARTDKIQPNLALMKISTWYKSKGHEVGLGYYDRSEEFITPIEDPDNVFISSVFTKSIDRVMELKVVYPDAKIGGSGYDIATTLPDRVEHLIPDYNLYDVDHSIGYTTRGCFRDCKFCIVPEKEGKIRHHSDIDEFLYPGHNKVKFLDNNFFAGPRWREHIKKINDLDLKVSFNQGVDIRIMTEEMAQAIESVKYRSGQFGGTYFHIAFDDTSYEDEFRKGVEILLEQGIRSNSVIVYILVGFNSTLEDNQYRLDVVREYDMYPFVMKYQGCSIVDAFFARWVNKRLYKKRPFDEYWSYDRWKRRTLKKYSKPKDLSNWA